MSVTEHARNQVYAWFEEHMSDEQAATMMTMLSQFGRGEVATKDDVDRLGERLEHKFDALGQRLDGKIDAMGQRLDGRIDLLDGKVDGMGQRLDGRIDLLDAKVDGVIEQMATKADLQALRSDLFELRSELQRTFVSWLLMAQASVVGLVGLMLAVLH